MSNLHGQIVRGYRLEDIAGSGGFGTVYHARQEILNREVAVKVINEKYVNRPQFIRQFEAEARIIARLEHLHIVTLYDYWRDPSGAYLIMRWLKGGSLRGYLKRNQMTIPQIVRLVNQISSALAFGHQLNVIHRDIKPENILLDETGNAFLTDFGIAVDLQNQENLDIENISFGSPDYVAPEQLTDKLITPKADIYSLGIMLYELLAHERPFRADTAKEIMQMQLRNPVPSLRLSRPDLPTEIDTIIWQATSKRPHSRYDNILELAVAFQSIATSIADVPSEYTIATETRRKHRQNLPIKKLPQASMETGMLDGFATSNLDEEPLATGILDESATGVLDKSETGQLDAMATGVLDDTELSGQQLTGQLDAMATGVLDDDPSDTAVFEETPVDAEDDIVMTVEVIGEGVPNPYKGLNAFEEGDADTFFGRERAVKQLLSQFSNPQKRFLALIGPSGSGKSSIIRAGLIPQFRKNAVANSANWFFSTMVPSNDPFREMSEALLRVSITAPENWGKMLRKNIQGLHKLLGMVLPEDNSQLLLFIDQFEEVFTLWDNEKEREIFLGSLWYALKQPNSHLRLIITLRADFYDRPLHYQQFAGLLRENTEVVLPLDFQELGAAILEPANKVGLKVDPRLANTLLEDVHSQPGALPLLQYTLTELYERRDKEAHEIRYDDYKRLGGISGALAERAQEIYFSRLNDNEQDLAQQLFLRLISIDENGTATRRRAHWHELMQGIEQEELENVINAFSRHRLLTTDSDPVTRIPTVEVAHEALISAWKELNIWIEDNRHALQKRQELRSETDRWLDNDRDNSYLASGLRLAEFEDLRDNRLLASPVFMSAMQNCAKRSAPTDAYAIS
jgi:serine/threonine protein kinase